MANAAPAYFAALEAGLGRMKAAVAADINYSAVRHARLTDPKFAEREQQALAVQINVIENALFEAAKSGNVTAIVFYLTNRAPKVEGHEGHEEWQDRRARASIVNIQKNESPDESEIDDELRRLAKELAERAGEGASASGSESVPLRD